MYKTIIEFPNYEVDESGNVRNRKSGRILKHNILKNGYHQVRLQLDGKQSARLVHRLVLQTFNPVEGMNELQVNHKDEDIDNCALSNLEWCTPKYNCNYGTRLARIVANHPLTKPVAQLDLDGNELAVFASTREANRVTGVYLNGIRDCASGKRHSAGGYKWLYTK